MTLSSFNSATKFQLDAEMTTARYQYCSLSLDEPTIRLLQLLPQDGDGNICLKLEPFSLKNVINRYAAVSYTWGIDRPDKKILIDGKPFFLRENIWQCLRHCANNGSVPSYLWVDSICINQDDTPEKNTQVQMMGEIFSKANRVLVWLRDVSDNHNLSGAFQKRGSRTEDETSLGWEHFLESEIPSDLHTSIPHTIRDELHKLLHNDYWQRLWIVQELALAQNAYLILGDMFVSIEDIAAMALFRLKRMWNDPALDDEPIQPLKPEHSEVMIVENLVAVHREKRRKKLKHLTLQFSEHKCQDPRDRLYGLLGLMDDRQPILVDYNLTNAEVFAKGLHQLQTEEDVEGFSGYSARLLMLGLKVTSESCATVIAQKRANGQSADHLNSEVDTLFELQSKYEVIEHGLGNAKCRAHHQLKVTTEGIPANTCLKDITSSSEINADQDRKLIACSLKNTNTRLVILLQSSSTNTNPSLHFLHFANEDLHADGRTLKTYRLDNDRIMHSLETRFRRQVHNLQDMWNGKLKSLTMPCSVLELVYLIEMDVKMQNERMELWRAIEPTFKPLGSAYFETFGLE